LNHVADADERERMILDLRTTGIFACVGEMVTFAAPLFHDYLVAEQLRVGTSIKRLPTLDQCKLLLGRLESGRPFRFGGVVEESPGFHCESLLDTTENRSALRSAGIEVGRPTMGALALARRRYVFDSVEGDRAVWKTVDGDRFLLFRALLTFRIGQGVTTGTGAVTFTVINRLGLHSRPAGFLCRAFSELIKRKGEGCRIGFTRDDESVGCSIMSLLMLAAGRGAEIRIDFEGCSQDEVEQALEEAGAHRANIEAENLTAGKWLFHGWDGRDHEQLARIAKKAGPTKS
jgi:phosphotransferase system HPr (HPr) family protein